MVHVKIVVVFIFILMSVFLQLKVEPQPTINSFGENSCPQLDEEWRIQAEEYQYIKLEFEKERQRLKTLENVSHSQSEEIQRLNVELQNERRLKQKSSLRRATAKLIKRISGFQSYALYSAIKVLDEIYVLPFVTNWRNSIKVFEARNQFRLLKEIALNGINFPGDMVYSNESKCVYIRDVNEDCIWQMTTEGDHRLTKWLTDVTLPSTLSLSNEGHLLVLRTGQLSNQLEIYSLNENLIRSIQLPNDVKKPRNAVQTSAGYYVIFHELTDALNGSLVISRVNSAGQLMNRFTPSNQFQVMDNVQKLFYDSDNNRLFVADVYNHRVILFDSYCLNWIQVLLSQETQRIQNPWSVFYDSIKRQLLVPQKDVLDIYELI